MKRHIPVILLTVPVFTNSCIENDTKPEPRIMPKTEHTAKSKKKPPENPDRSLLPEENPSAPKRSLAAKQQQKRPRVEVKTQNNVPDYPENKDLDFKNPALDKWANAYLNDPQWQEQYLTSIAYYLSSVQRNLDQNPERKTDKSTIVSNYREKMSQTFYRSPEFVEFARNQFEKSPELATFLSRNAGQITVD